jgi:hypothetical protein
MLTFTIEDIFKITNRGHVFTGYLREKGTIHSGDRVLVMVDYKDYLLKIIEVSSSKMPDRLEIVISFSDFEKIENLDLKKQGISILDVHERLKTEHGPILWTGDLSDDCTARWGGLMLRAEWMDEEYWWWAVYDFHNEEVTIDSSNNYTERVIGGEAARLSAEKVAKDYLDVID